MRLAVEVTETENLFETLANKSPVGLYIVQDGRFCYTNPTFQSATGYREDELPGRDSLELVVPEDRERVKENAIKMLKGELTSPYQFRVTHKNGSIKWVMESVVSIQYLGKRATLGDFVDITEHKRADEALREAEEEKSALLEEAPISIMHTDLKGKITYINKRFESESGYSREEIAGKNGFKMDWVPAGTMRYLTKRMAARLRGRHGKHWETQFKCKDGRWIWVELEGKVLRKSGVPVGFQIIARDITERKQAEEAIKHAAEEWRETFDSISDAISIHDRGHKILRVNKACAEFFHKEPRQILGSYCYELHKGNKPIAGCPHKQTLATKKPAEAEFYESNLGKYLHESTSPIFDEEGEVVGTVHITRDITEQKQQNERLMMADRLVSIGELAAGTAHEINNPLTSIIGFSQLLMKKDIPDDIREDLKLIYSEAQRAADVTNNLLTFARKHTPVKQPNQINNIIEDVLKLRAYGHKANGIEVERQLAPDLPEIMVDYLQMQQVFLNIIINAEHSMTEAHKGGALTITTQKQDSNVSISIADDGTGIPPENLNRIFNPFFTTKEAGKGTGLGLSICHGIVSEHGGRIYARSQLGEGATVFVELPINGRRLY